MKHKRTINTEVVVGNQKPHLPKYSKSKIIGSNINKQEYTSPKISFKTPLVSIFQVLKSKNKRFYIIFFILLSVVTSAGYLIVKKYYDNNNPDQSNLTGIEEYVDRRESSIKSGGKVEFFDYLVVGNSYILKKDYNNAQKYYLEAYKLAPEDVDVNYALATVYRLEESKTQSLQYYEKVIELASNPTNHAHSNLSIYKSEKDAVSKDDFELKSVERTYDIPL